MYHADTFNDRIKLYLKIMWPILVTQLSLAMMNLVDTIMAGRVGTNDLAGVAIGASIWSPVLAGMYGLTLAVTTMVAYHVGQNEKNKIHNTVMQGMYLIFFVAILVLIAGALILTPILTRMDLEPAVSHTAKHYLIGLSFGIVPLFISTVLRNFYDGQGLTRISMFITILAVPFNVLFNYSLIFGKFGLPALGGIGAGYATALTYWVILIASIITIFKVPLLRKYRLFIHWPKPSLGTFLEQLKIGGPMGLSIIFEASIFSVVTIIIGSMFSTIVVAANQIVLSFTSLIFMVPLSLSMALTIIVSFSIAGGRLDNAKHYSFVGVTSSITVLGMTAIFLLFNRELVARFYSSDADVIAYAGGLFLIAILYQLSDGAQAGLQGVLRGFKDVKVPFIIAFTAYWIFGIPTGYLLAKYTELGPFGLWIGLSVGLTSAAIGFFIRLRFVYKKAVQKIS